jgi:hypothetical protein
VTPEDSAGSPPRREVDRGIEDEGRPPRRPGGEYAPHRGVLILVFAIIGLVGCPIFAPIAWYMGNADLKEIRAGRMDREGESLTNIGRILGIVGTCLLILSCFLYGCLAVIFVPYAMQGGVK